MVDEPEEEEYEEEEEGEERYEEEEEEEEEEDEHEDQDKEKQDDAGQFRYVLPFTSQCPAQALGNLVSCMFAFFVIISPGFQDEDQHFGRFC